MLPSSPRAIVLLTAALVALAACDRQAPAPAPSAAEPSSAPPPASERPAPEPALSTAASSEPSPAPAAGDAGATSDGGAACGTKPLPDCPLQGWMKQHLKGDMRPGDLAEVARSLDTVATFAPSGYDNWASIARDGANAARGGDLDGTKASCRGCHQQYKSKYRAELRARPL